MQCLTCGMMNIDPLSHTHTKETQSMSDTLQEREDQMDQHQVNKSGTCVIPGCPCRGWSAQETATIAKESTMTTEERIKQIPACVECGAVQFTRYGHFPECSQFIADADEPDTAHQPAVRGGGERVILNSDLVVRPLPKTLLKTSCLLTADDGWPIAEFYREEEAEGIAYEHNQHQSLVAERELLRGTIEVAIHNLNAGNDPKFLTDYLQLTLDQQRSTPE